MRKRPVLILPQEHHAAILAQLREALPDEGCGLLATVMDEHSNEVAVHYFPGSNLDASPSRFTMAPAEVIEAHKTIRNRGWRLGAIVHSHPASPPVPSATDLREAYYPDSLLLIVSFADGPPIIKAWATSKENAVSGFVARPIVIPDHE